MSAQDEEERARNGLLETKFFRLWRGKEGDDKDTVIAYIQMELQVLNRKYHQAEPESQSPNDDQGDLCAAQGLSIEDDGIPEEEVTCAPSIDSNAGEALASTAETLSVSSLSLPSTSISSTLISHGSGSTLMSHGSGSERIGAGLEAPN